MNNHFDLTEQNSSRGIAAVVDARCKRETTAEFVRFLLTGGFAALVNLMSRYLLTPLVGFGTSIVVAYVIGMVVAYMLFRSLVFGRSERGIASESIRFVIVNIVALCLVWMVSIGLARGLFPLIGWTWHAEDIAHFIGVCVPAFSSYIGHSKYTFRRA